MKQKIIKALGLLMFLPVFVLSQEHPDSLFRQAQKQYDAGNYTESAVIYHQIVAQNIESASLHYNLGNAYFRSDELGEAILHYEKARQLNPRDEDIRYNLKIARARIQDRIEPPENSILIRVFNTLKYLLNLHELAWLTAGIFLLGGFLFSLWWILRRTRIRTFIGHALVVCSILFLLVAPLLVSRTIEAHKHTYGIILQKEVQVRSAPQQLTTTVFTLHEGTKMEVEGAQNQWYQIRLVDGKEGWIPVNAVGII